jgi:hypothetical protein
MIDRDQLARDITYVLAAYPEDETALDRTFYRIVRGCKWLLEHPYDPPAGWALVKKPELLGKGVPERRNAA